MKSPLPRTLAESLRNRSEHYLTVAAQEDLRRRYPTGTRPSAAGSGGPFWRTFVHVYRRVPWATMQRVIGAARMTSQGWTPPPRQPSEPWRPPTGRAGPPPA
jgi:hypothetical protein